MSNRTHADSTVSSNQQHTPCTVPYGVLLLVVLHHMSYTTLHDIASSYYTDSDVYMLCAVQWMLYAS
jgi:hypothetical protein